MFYLSQLCIYPVKSMRGLQLSHAQITESGLAFDRIFMLTDYHGKFITARQYPKLICFTPALIRDGVVIQAPDGKNKTIFFNQFSQQPQATEVWGNHFTSFIAPNEINQWLSDYLQRDIQLRWLGEYSNRRVKHYPDNPLSFADGYPFMLINEASLQSLQSRCQNTLSVHQFRPNLVVNGFSAFAEDSWKTIRIGDVIFDVIKPCSRCILTTFNPETGKKYSHGEPLSVLQQFRTNSQKPKDIDFGINLIARNNGIIRYGDNIEILEQHPPAIYLNLPSMEKDSIETSIYKELTITYQNKTFIGNNQQVILEQLEKQGIQINYSCRAGICGCCRLKLIKGKVRSLKKSDIIQNNSLLACSSIPIDNIELSEV